MSLLLDPGALERRRALVNAPDAPLAPLAASLRADLAPLVRASAIVVPAEKALLSRDGGRCPRDHTPLTFDPYAPFHHRCPTCAGVYRGERHHRWWITYDHLWLAERAVHAAALHALTGEPALAHVARDILAAYAERYLTYPDRDNVLGPSRPFFSTYLESIWLLQLAVAIDLLESVGAAAGLGGMVRDRIIAPSAALIGSFDEGGSNRQLWNVAACLAAARLLGDDATAERLALGPAGVSAHLASGLLPDATWYEGENYHFFAHRGLWYGVTIASAAGISIPAPLLERFDDAFATPLATALPDFTFPARRDSQYGVSLRQWRFAESCELGLARRGDARLRGALRRLYDDASVPRRDTGRWRSTAEAERNELASALTPADLGWRSLLFAAAELPELPPAPPSTVLLPSQGIAVFRRDQGRLYAALDYGHSGGGHGHPDRLDLLLVHGDARWLDDMGTGSYVDPSLHWYRSTLAHNAPLVAGRSQPRVDGVLRAFEERGDAGWVQAELPLRARGETPAVRLIRTLVVVGNHLVDRVEWQAAGAIRLELPIHFPAAAALEGWQPAPLDGGSAPDDGFGYLRDTAAADVAPFAAVRLGGDATAGGPAAWVVSDAPTRWWRATAPGPPNAGPRPFHVVRAEAASGAVTSVWSWRDEVRAVRVTEARVAVEGSHGSWTHTPGDTEWRIDVREPSGGDGTVTLGRDVAVPPPRRTTGPPRCRTPVVEASAPPRLRLTARAPLRFELQRDAYRRSEESWEEAGRPEATVSLTLRPAALRIDVLVRKAPLVFRPAHALDPALDNEPPDIHSDGVQLHLLAPGWESPAGWLVNPELDGGIRVRDVAGGHRGVPLDASWSPTDSGYAVCLEVPLAELAPHRPATVGIDVLVNEIAPGRQRRRGQLVLSGGAGEWVYLRGDRQPADRLLPVYLADV